MNTASKSYNNTNRRRKAEETKLLIIRAWGRLWTKYPIHDITLDMIAEEAGVTTRTVLRKFGSKEGLLTASLSYDPAEITIDRAQAIPGNVDNILQTLLAGYEKMGDAAIRTIQLESELEIARTIGNKGRAMHRSWCKAVFADFLPPVNSIHYEIQLTSFIAATEIYLWKLMRKDLAMSKKATFKVFKNMLEGVIHQYSEINEL